METIIYPPTINWTWMKQRPQQLMKSFARNGYQVFFCNQTQLPNHPVEKIQERLFIVHDHEDWLKKEWPAIRVSSDKITVWCSWSKWIHRINEYAPDRILYDCVDDFPQWRLDENEMIHRAEGIICTSQRLYERLKRSYPDKQLQIVRNGYDHDMALHVHEGDNPIRPGDLPENARFIVGYIGAWAAWVDEALIEKISRIGKDIHTVLIGAEFERKFSLARLPNVHYLGHKPHEQLPLYLRCFDVCIIPFRINAVTLATNPVKAYEYLAAGKPVISTNLPECRMMHPYIDTAKDHTEFLRLLHERLFHPGSPIHRKEYALQNSWNKRAEECISFLNSI